MSIKKNKRLLAFIYMGVCQLQDLVSSRKTGYGNTSEPQNVRRLEELNTNVNYGVGIVRMINNAYR